MTSRWVWLRRRCRPSLTIIRGCSAAGTASSASAPMYKAHDGVDIPAPPPIDSGMQGQVISNGAHCPTCQGNVVVSGPVMSHDAHAPGYAVVGGPGGPRRLATRWSVKPWSDPSRRPSVSRRCGITARWTLAWPRWVLARVRARSIRRWFRPICRRPRLHSRHRRRIDRTSSATSSGCRTSASYHRERQDRERQKHASIAYGQAEQPGQRGARPRWSTAKTSTEPASARSSSRPTSVEPPCRHQRGSWVLASSL